MAATTGRHRGGRPLVELLEEAAAGDWDTSLLSVHARRHRPYVAIPTPLPSRWTWTGDLYDITKEGNALMPWGIGRGGSNQPEISTGEQYQCDCTASGCPCTRWGNWVAAGTPVPSQVRCDQCQRGDHSG